MGDYNTRLAELKETLARTIAAVNKAKNIGRPPGSNIALEVEPILIASLQNGLNITQACLQAGISRETYYAERKVNNGFSDRLDKAEQFASMKSRQNIMRAINSGSVADSWRYLERKDPEFKPKSDFTSDDKPIPLLGVTNVSNDYSPAEGTESTQTN